MKDIRGHEFHHPVQAMRDYLTAIDSFAARYRAMPPASAPRVLAALGPRMLSLAAELADGAHTYRVPPEHTADARRLLGSAKFLIPEQAVVLETDSTRARQIARQHLRRYLPLPSYTDNLRRYGFDDSDFADNGSDRLIDALVAWGDVDTISQRVKDHRQAGPTTFASK